MTAKYHMLDYIHESPATLEKTLKVNQLKINEIVQMARERKVNKVVLSGLGSSYTAAMMSAPLFQQFCPFPTAVINSEETNYYSDRWIDRHSLVVVVSRSGERGAVIDTLNLANQKGALAVAVTGMADSLLAQNSKISLTTQEGAEITFPKTKSVTACTGMMMHLGLELADREDQIAKNLLQQLMTFPSIIDQNTRAIEPQLKALMPLVKKCQLLNVAGTCSNHGAALEAAIKVQEASFIPTRGDSTAGLLQGPVGALNADWLVLALIMAQDKNLSLELLKLVRQFGAQSIGVYPQGMDLGDACDHSLVLPAGADPFLAALAYLPAVQLLAYFWTLERGMNPDEPSSMNSILKSILPPGREEPELKK
jgi:glucosamine--fructose-6-phosphate aminotransferase (isomerizing)